MENNANANSTEDYSPTFLKLQSVVYRLIPASWPTDYGSQNRAVNLIGLLFGYGLLMTLYTPVYFWQGADYAAWASLILLTAHFCMIYWMYRGAPFDAIRYFTLANVFLTGSTTLWLQGAGSDSPQGVWIAFTPFAAAFIAGPVQAVAILVLAVVFFLGVIWLKVANSTFFYFAPVPDPVMMNTIHTIALLFGFTMLALYFLFAQTLHDREMNLARQKADKLSRAKGEFLANMSHEIRTPMNAIVGMSYLALQSDLNSRQRNQIERVNRAAQSLLGIINDILDFSKIEAGKLTMESIDFSLDDVLDNLADMVGPKSEGKDLELLYDIAPDVPTLLVGDPLRLGQVLVNLGNNAVKFTNSGQIKLSITRVESAPNVVQLRFSLEDTGIGMTQRQVDSLFQSFNQADNSTTRKYGGTGLGLAITKTLVEMMNGHIWVESRMGLGSTFVFDARLGVQSHIEPVEGKEHLQVAALQRCRVLIVDDNAASRDILVNMLQKFALQLATAERGDIALQVAMQADRNGTPFDLVLMDWRMPGMDGMQCALKLRDLGLTKPPAVIMVTAYGYDQAAGLTDNAPGLIKGVVVKPVIKSVLLAKIQTALDSSTAQGPALSALLVESDRQAQAIAHLRGARILLAEDNEVNRELAVQLFEYAGLNVVVAHQGQEALDILERDRAFDGILMDCQMPVMDGYTVTRHICQRPELRSIPVIAMTANAMAGDKEAAIAAGMIDHISKPLDVEKMFVTMARWITPAVRTIADTSSLIPQTESVALPRVEGIDQDFGLRVSAGNKALYRRLLGKFAISSAGFGEQFQKARQDADATAAIRSAHSLKGSAANLGIKGVESRALQLELACKTQADAATIDRLLQDVLAELTPVLAGLQALPNNEFAQAASVQMDGLARSALWQQLRDELTDDDSQAQDTLRRYLSAIKPLPPHLARLAGLVENFEFRAALALLDSTTELTQQQSG